MSCGVPQGSILRPFLWDIGFGWVMPSGVSVVCYTEDTLVLAQGESDQAVANPVTLGVASFVERIWQLGLLVALHKSKPMCFQGRRKAKKAYALICRFIMAVSSSPYKTQAHLVRHVATHELMYIWTRTYLLIDLPIYSLEMYLLLISF